MIKRIFSFTATFLLLLSFCVNLKSQEYWDFGDGYTAQINTPSDTLQVTMVTDSSLLSSKFVSRVGGVAFIAVAEPDEAIKNKSIKLDYKSNSKDGYRLSIVIGKDSLNPYIPDWQLIPIVKYSASTYNSCVSLFGPMADSLSWDIVYHPAFQNTLLGLRLLQADLVLMNMQTFSSLPKFNNKIYYGEGETIPDVESWKESAYQIQSLIMKTAYQSWVLTDDGIHIKFNVSAKNLIFEGEPYYYFWKTDYDNYLKKTYELNKKYEDLIIRHNQHVVLYNENNNETDTKIIELLKNEIFITENEIQNKEYTILPVTEATDVLKSKYYLFKKVNPPVYNAVLNVAQYSAFFRHIKEKNPSEWNRFFEKTKFVQVSPILKTPTILPKPKQNLN